MIGFKRYFRDLVGVHIDGFAFARAVPLVFLLVVAIELTQHIIEVRIGFFGSAEQRRAVAMDSSRLVLGWMKMLSIYGVGWIAIRYYVFESASCALVISTRDIVRYAPVIAYQMALFIILFHGPRMLQAIGLAIDAKTLRTTVGLAQVFGEPLLFLWFVGAATDGPVKGPISSARTTALMYFWALALFFVARLPINGLHQAGNVFAAGQPDYILWPLLIFDAFVVGLIAAIIPAIYVRVARTIGEKRGFALDPGSKRLYSERS